MDLLGGWPAFGRGVGSSRRIHPQHPQLRLRRTMVDWCCRDFKHFYHTPLYSGFGGWAPFINTLAACRVELTSNWTHLQTDSPPTFPICPRLPPKRPAPTGRGRPGRRARSQTRPMRPPPTARGRCTGTLLPALQRQTCRHGTFLGAVQRLLCLPPHRQALLLLHTR